MSELSDFEKDQLRRSNTVAVVRQRLENRSKRCQLPSLPVIHPRATGSLRLPAGLHLLIAPAAGGKTITALGLYNWIAASGLPCAYQYAYEPLARVPMIGISTKSHSDLLIKCGRAAGSPITTVDEKSAPATQCYGYAVLDSISLAIRMLPSVGPMAKNLGDQAYSKGLKPADLVGASVHNSYATALGIVLIATINSEMLPIVNMLKGVAMGIHTIGAPGSFGGDDRTDRVRKPTQVPYEYMNEAAIALGYGKFKGVGGDTPTEGRV